MTAVPPWLVTSDVQLTSDVWLVMAKPTVMGGLQVCSLACRPCNDGSVTVTTRQESFFSSLRKKSTLARNWVEIRRGSGLQTSVRSRIRRRREREREREGEREGRKDQKREVSAPMQGPCLSPCRWAGPGLMLQGAEHRDQHARGPVYHEPWMRYRYIYIHTYIYMYIYLYIDTDIDI